MKRMKKTLLLTIVVFVLLILTGCKPDSGPVSDPGKKPEPLGEADIYIYDKDGQKTDKNHIGILLEDDYVTYRGVHTGDSVKVIADKYILSDFEVVSLETERTTATLENIGGEEFQDISADFMVNGKKYSLSFTINEDTITMISVYLYPEE